ncbi:hypothetical protein [Calothrix sp. PCC 6303]|uniref:hypothetical protein n=1 Tax=Calothrix sp. PCC 6303 TaxID=1170562 RepID=UPI0002A0443B|nr:hypothetical protein [Calothrix sp. PCC 6303]AFZ01497.1 hypothetical protein Cal6303_2506 [Calothrix sp. PCC 6303]
MLKPRLFSVTAARVVILTSCLGAIATGCANSIASNSQTPNHQSSDRNPLPSVEQASERGLEQTEQTSTTNKSGEKRRSRRQNSNSPSLKPNLREGMSYQKARQLLLQQGWKPHLQADEANLNNITVRELYDYGYVEIKDCSGTGVGACLFEFVNQSGDILLVSARAVSENNKEREIWRWSIEKKRNRKKPASSDSQYSQNSYSQKPPFIGTKFFKFYDGDSSEQSITILADGTTTVKINGRGQTYVFYQGKFTNPIVFQDNSGSGLLLKDDKIFSTYGNGKIAIGCKGDGKPCVSDLFEPTATTPEPVKVTNIQDGYYVLGGTGQGLEVRGNKYRYYDEGGEKEWQDISQLKSIKAGLIFDGREYWCLPPDREGGVCTENGWKRL